MTENSPSPRREHDAIHALVHHVVASGYEVLSPEAIQATKTFILDTLGVAMVGTLAPGVDEMLTVIRNWGGKEECTVLRFGDKLPASSAAMVNSFFMHNQEFDCVHDPSVVHAFTTALPAALSMAEVKGEVTGKELLTAVALGVDVSGSIGMASRAAMTHFRPGTAGAFGAIAAAGKVLGLGEATLANAMGIGYSQICGTLQPHHEGAMVNSMQTGFNVRGAMTAVALATKGVIGSMEVLEGRYGYFRLFEGEYQLDDVVANLGRVWQVERVAHKPFPCGRLTQGVVEAALKLRDRHGIAPEDIVECEATVPPLVHRLVGRPMDRSDPPAQYAKLSIPFVVATALIKNSVFVTDFQGDALRDLGVHDLAQRIRVVLDTNVRDENAMGPVRLRITLGSGAVHELSVRQALGHPDNPLSREQHLDKFRRCWATGAGNLPEANCQEMIDLVDHLADLARVEDIVRFMIP